MKAEFPPPLQRYGELRFCPRCGQRYGPGDFHPVECLFDCAACGFDFYQNPLPAAVVALSHPSRPDSVLILRRRTPPGIGLWCVPGGFIRYGEPPEAAAAREVREEAGIEARIGPVLRVGMMRYAYRERELCILEVAYHAEALGPLPEPGRSTAEADEMAFRPASEVIAQPALLAFPEQLEVLRAFQAAIGCR